MKPMILLIAFTLVFTALVGQARGDSIFVNAAANPRGDGSGASPYQTISAAIAKAREIRERKAHSKIVVHVAPGVYSEVFPIYLNVSNLELRGSTQIIDDDDGLPGNCGTDSAPEPCVEPGTETLIAATIPIGLGQRLLTVAPTRDSSGDSLTDIGISGFVFDGKAPVVASGGDAIFVDRVGGFSIHHNVARRVRIGILTIMSSGRIRENFVSNSNDGIAVIGGSSIYPATVQISSNRAINNVEQGAVAVGAATFNFLDPNLKEVQRLFDPAQHPEQVPDTLVVEAIGNDFSHSPRFGFRFELYTDGETYNTSDNQPLTSNITATLRHNTFNSNREYAVVVDAFPTRTNPRNFTSVFTGSFENNDFSGSGRAGVFAGFMLNGVVTRNPGLINRYKYQQNSLFTLQMDEASNSLGLNYDNPVFDPVDRTTPLNNTLIVNGATVIGTHVTCPPGFPCVP